MKRYKFPFFVLLMTVVAGMVNCQKSPEQTNKNNPAVSKSAGPIREINGIEQLKTILTAAGERLQVFDLYADWCRPCRTLSPLLEEIARNQKKQADFYKINIDYNRDLAGMFRVSGIPYVVMVKNQRVVQAFTGLHPRDTYVRAISEFSSSFKQSSFQPDGRLENGLRTIRFQATSQPRDIYVNRGETVQIEFARQDFPFSVHIPGFKISRTARTNESLTVTFKAKNTGIFPIFCNGNCPAGDGAQHGQIVVMTYKPEKGASYREISAKEGKEMLADPQVLLLDVRTPKEHYTTHIPDSRLIPLNQLQERLSEIENHKDKPILVYCRSGNRSTVAAEILVKNGFQNISALRHGILEWQQQGFPVKKDSGKNVF